MSSSVRPIAMAWLEQSGECRYVESETRIGRGEHNDIRLNDPSVSRDHALIRRVDGAYVVSDLDSANGTFVNGQRVYAPRTLLNGDRVKFAETDFVFNVDVPETSTQEPTSTSISQFLTISGQIDIQNYLQGELRVVTVLFLDLVGFTALSETMSPEQVTLVMQQCFQHLTDTAIRFNGFVDKYTGDGMMVLFGAPGAHQDDPEHAVRAAIAMQEALATYSDHLQQRSGIALQMRVGISTGEVLAGEIGSGQFSAFTVMGATVNLASRLEGQARIGHILVNEATYELTKQSIRYTALPPTAIRGINESVLAYEVIGLAPEEEIAAIGRQDPFAGGPSRAELGEMLRAGTTDIRSLLRIRSVVQAQLDELDRDERDLLRITSIAGQPWTADFIGLVLGVSPKLSAMLSHLVELGLLQQSDSSPTQYELSDPVVRAVVDASLPEMERRRLHERVALGLQREYDPTRPDPDGLRRIAQHFANAAKHWQGVEYLLRSADLAVAGAAPSAAVQTYRSVLDEAQQVTDQKERTRLVVELQERLGDALLKDGRLAEAQIAFESAAGAASAERELELHLKLAVTSVRRGNPRRVLQIGRTLLEQAALTDHSRASAELLCALALVSQGLTQEALERAERGKQLLVDGADAASVGLAHYAAGRAHFVAGQLRSARDELQLSIAARGQVSDTAAVAESYLLMGQVQCELGDLDEAEACVRRALGAGHAVDKWNRANAGLVFGRVLRLRGDRSRGERHVRDALRWAESAGARELALELQLELARMVNLSVEEIQPLLDIAVSRELESVACRARVELSNALCSKIDAAGSRDQVARSALKAAHEAALRSRRLGLGLHEALARRALGQVLALMGNWAHADGEFRAAAAIQERQGAAVELIVTRVAASRAEYVYAASPRLPQLRAQLTDARRAAERIGFQHEREEAARLLAALHD